MPTYLTKYIFYSHQSGWSSAENGAFRWILFWSFMPNILKHCVHRRLWQMSELEYNNLTAAWGCSPLHVRGKQRRRGDVTWHQPRCLLHSFHRRQWRHRNAWRQPWTILLARVHRYWISATWRWGRWELGLYWKTVVLHEGDDAAFWWHRDNIWTK